MYDQHHTLISSVQVFVLLTVIKTIIFFKMYVQLSFSIHRHACTCLDEKCASSTPTRNHKRASQPAPQESSHASLTAPRVTHGFDTYIHLACTSSR